MFRGWISHAIRSASDRTRARPIVAAPVDQRERFERGELVVRWAEIAGTNLCSAYHPERYLRETFADGFELVELVPEGALGNPTQDLVLLRKA